MSGLTRSQLQALKPLPSLSALASALRAKAAAMQPQESQFAERLRHPGGGEEWTGQASDALQARAQSVQQTISGFDAALLATAGHCDQAAGHLDTAVNVVRSKVADTEGDMIGLEADGRYWHCGNPFAVGEDFIVAVNPAQVEPGAPNVVFETLGHLAQEHQEQISSAVRQLEESSEDWKGKIAGAMNLDQLALNASGHPYAPYDPNNTVAQQADAIASGTMDIPSDPKQLHDLWQQLNKDQKEAIYNRYHDIGNHGGIPFDPPDHLGRDHYNQRHLKDPDGLIAQKQAEIDKARAEHPEWDPHHNPFFKGGAHTPWQEWSDRVNALQHDMDGYKNVESTLDRSKADGKPRFLGFVDKRQHAAVALYNPDNAKYSGLIVPGTYSDLGTMGDYDDRSQRIINSAMNASHGQLQAGDVSMTEWLSYDRPMSVSGIDGHPPWAGGPSLALNGAQPLDDYLHGMRASHNDVETHGPAYQTVIGHSYGTCVVGAAATHGHTLDANAVALLASPGAFASSASELSLAHDGKTFVGKSFFDPIDIANVGQMFGLSELGPDPTHWGDAYRMDAGSGGHSSYWDQDNPAMKNLGRIVIGEDGNSGVTPY